MAFSIIEGKEGQQPKSPLFLVTITAPDGDVCYLTSKASLGAANLVYGGNTYLARIQKNDLQAIQSMGPQGYATIPGFTLTLADADLALWNSHCMTHGWRGSVVTLTVILWDLVASAFSTDAILWTFIGGNPQHNHKSGATTLDVISSNNYTRIRVPSIALEYRCPWDFPTTAAQRNAGLNNPTSIYYQCGYSPDIGGGVGNYATGTTPFTTCDLTRSSPTDPSVGCMARMGNAATTTVAPDGDLEHDKAGHYTARFGGITLVMPAQFSGTGYSYVLTGVRTFGFNQPNTSLIGAYYNWVYGTQWVTGHVLAPGGDANSLRSEVAVCVSAFGPAIVRKVIVNGVEVPFNNDGSGGDKLFTWRFAAGRSVADAANPGLNVGAGGRSGKLNGDAYFSGNNGHPFGPNYAALGDPHGSLCVIEFVVPAQLAQPGSIPSVQVLVTSGPILSTDGETFFFVPPDIMDGHASAPAANAAFALLDLHAWGNMPSSQMDPASWFTASQKCATTLSYTAADGSTQTHAQFKASFQLSGSSRQVLAQVITAVKNSANLMTGKNGQTGLLECWVKETLGNQQPGAVTGSNDATARASVTPAGASRDGYFAYVFDATNIDADSFRITTTPIEATPNTVSFAFQDEENGFQQDSLSQTNPSSYAYSGDQEIAVPVPINAVPNFDQGSRVANTQLGEALYGNPRDDAGGTLYFEFTCNHRVLHLAGRLGFICGLFWEPAGIGTSASPQAIRILSLRPDTDGEHWEVKAAWHRDEWYTYLYGQKGPTPFKSNPLLNPPARPTYPWRPGQPVWSSTDALFPSKGGFQVSLDVSAYPAKLAITGAVPVNAAPSGAPPILPLQGSTANTGGFIPPGSYHVAFSTNGLMGPVDLLFCNVVVLAGTNTNTITVSGIRWPGGAAPSIQPFIGSSSMEMRASDVSSYTGSSADTNGNPTTYVFTAITPGSVGLPDTNFSEFLVEETPIIHGGAYGGGIASVDGTGLILTFGTAFSVNQFAGRVLSLYYRPGADPQPALNMVITSNTAADLTMPSTGFLAGDVIVIRLKATTFSASTIGDANLVNNGGAGLIADGEIGALIMIVKGAGSGYPPKTVQSNTATVYTINGTFDETPDATSEFIVLEPTVAYSYYTKAFSNSDGTAVSAIATTPAITSVEQSLLVTVSACDVTGTPAPLQYQPWREIYIPPQGAVSEDGYFTVTPVAGSVTIDLANGVNQRLVLSASAVTILPPIFTGGSINAGMSFSLYVDQDFLGNRAIPTFTGGAGGFASDVQAQQIDGTASTRTAYQFTFHGTVWGLDIFRTGGAIS